MSLILDFAHALEREGVCGKSCLDPPLPKPMHQNQDMSRSTWN